MFAYGLCLRLRAQDDRGFTDFVKCVVKLKAWNDTPPANQEKVFPPMKEEQLKQQTWKTYC